MGRYVFLFEGVYANYRHPGPWRVLGGSNPTVLAQNRPAPEIAGRVPGILGPYMPPLEPYKAQIWPIHGPPQKKTAKIGHIYGLYMAIYTNYILPIYRYIYRPITGTNP